MIFTNHVAAGAFAVEALPRELCFFSAFSAVKLFLRPLCGQRFLQSSRAQMIVRNADDPHRRGACFGR